MMPALLAARANQRRIRIWCAAAAFGQEPYSLGVDYQIRETFESAMIFGEAALRELGVAEEDAAEIAADVRRRDAERFELQMASDIYAGTDLLRKNTPTPTPLTKPRRAGKIFNADGDVVVAATSPAPTAPKPGA